MRSYEEAIAIAQTMALDDTDWIFPPTGSRERNLSEVVTWSA